MPMLRPRRPSETASFLGAAWPAWTFERGRRPPWSGAVFRKAGLAACEHGKKKKTRCREKKKEMRVSFLYITPTYHGNFNGDRIERKAWERKLCDLVGSLPPLPHLLKTIQSVD